MSASNFGDYDGVFDEILAEIENDNGLFDDILATFVEDLYADVVDVHVEDSDKKDDETLHGINEDSNCGVRARKPYLSEATTSPIAKKRKRIICGTPTKNYLGFCVEKLGHIGLCHKA